MTFLTLILLAFALAMDAFAVAIVTGLSLNPMKRRQVFRLSFHFGLFQALMPFLGWATGAAIQRHIENYDHWIAFGLLAFVGGHMILNAIRHDPEQINPSDPTTGWKLVLLSIATSIDALAVGFSLALIGSDILIPALVIGVVAAFATAIGMALGRRIGIIWGHRVEIIGGTILILLGTRILLNHLTVSSTQHMPF